MIRDDRKKPGRLSGGDFCLEETCRFCTKRRCGSLSEDYTGFRLQNDAGAGGGELHCKAAVASVPFISDGKGASRRRTGLREALLFLRVAGGRRGG